jgi:hypothetical protein
VALKSIGAVLVASRLSIVLFRVETISVYSTASATMAKVRSIALNP